MMDNRKTSFPIKENVCAIIVTYNPDSDFANNLKLIKEIVSKVVIIDNGSTQVEIIEHILENTKDIFLLKNNENKGIAQALNQGVEWAIIQKFDWVYTFDQDSKPSNKLLECHQKIIKNIECDERISLIGTKHTTNLLLNESEIDDGFDEVKVTITSGSLMSVAAYKEIGPFRDSFFIDAVDHEYCLRSIQKGFKIYETSAALMEHNIGNNSTHKFLIWNPMTSNHSLIRRYYMFRNNTIINKEYLFKEPKWVWSNIKTITRVSVYMTVFEKEKWKKLKVLIKGVFDGLLNKEGKL